MLFQTATVGLLFLGTFVAFYGLPKRFRLLVLGTSSLLFYAASGLLDFSLLIGTLGISYWLSLRVKPGGPKWPVVAGVLLLFVSLAFFKYDEVIYDDVKAKQGQDYHTHVGLTNPGTYAVKTQGSGEHSKSSRNIRRSEWNPC